jgi:membrane fusion protein (multidrug efflux system)
MQKSLFLLLPLLVAGCDAGGGPPEKGDGKWGRKKGEEEAVPVKVEKLGRGLISQRLLTTTTVEAVHRIDLVARAGGPVQEIFAAEGGLVEAGKPVARLDDEGLRLAEKKADVNASKARADFEHMETLLKDKFVSLDEFRKAEQAWKTAQLELETAQLAVRNATILAPIGGTLTKFELQMGRHVASGAVIGEITDLRTLECVIFVPERDVLKLTVGQPATVASDSLKAEFGATVKRVGAVVDRTSGTSKAWLEVKDPGAVLRPGMFVDVAIVIEPHPDALLVPKKALVFDEGKPGVFVRTAETVKWSALTLGFQEKDVAEVLEGAKDGDEVVVVGQNGLKDGAKIKVLTEGTQ